MKEPENLRHDIIGLLRNKLFKEMAQIFNFPQIGHFLLLEAGAFADGQTFLALFTSSNTTLSLHKTLTS